MENGQYVDGSYWFYVPDHAAAIAFSCLFNWSGLWHLWQCFQYHSWRVTGLFTWSAALFVTGFILRSIGAIEYTNLPIFISSTVFLYAAPPMYELSNYIILSRLLHFIPHLSPLHPARIITTFAGISVLVEALTANGAQRAVNSSSSPSQIAVGKDLLKAALILQLFVLALFVAVAGRFHYNCNKVGMLAMASDTRRKILGVLVTLYISSTLIGTRTIYRTVEYFATAAIQTPQAGEVYDLTSISPVIRYEWFFYVFEATLMCVNTVMWNFRHPGMYLPKTITTYLGEDGVEREGCKFKDPRNMVVQILDPFDIWGLVKGNDKKDRWWEKADEGVGADVELETEVKKQSETLSGDK